MVQGSLQSLEVDLQAESAYGETTQKNGFSAGETVFGAANGSPIWRGIEILDDGFGLAASMQRNNQAIKANLSVQRQGEVVGIETTGSINPIAAGLDTRTAYNRSIVAWILGSSLNRDATTNKLRSYSMRWHTPGVSTESFYGCKVSSLTVEASEDNGTVDFNQEWIAAAYSIDDDAAVSPVFPQQLLKTASTTPAGSPGTGWTFSRAYVIIDGTAIATIRSLSVTINNNLEPSAPKVKTELDGSGDVIDTFVIAELREQAPAITGNIVLDYLNHTYTDLMLADTEFEVVILARHPQSNVFGVATMPTNATTGTWKLTDDGNGDWLLDTAVGAFKGTTPADGDFGLIAGGALLIENTEDASVLNYERDITVVIEEYKTSDDGVIVDDVGFDYWTPVGTLFASLTPAHYLIYDQAMGIRFTGMKIDSGPLEGGAADIIGQNLSIVGGQFDSTLPPILWVVGNSANAVS